MLIYVLSWFKLPINILKSIEKVLRDFLLEGPNQDGGLHNGNWEKTLLLYMVSVGIGKKRKNKRRRDAPDGNLEHHLFEVISACSGIQENGHF